MSVRPIPGEGTGGKRPVPTCGEQSRTKGDKAGRAGRTPLSVALLWHFHQPDYREPGTGTCRLPWVRLHGVKDYLDMLLRVEREPGLKVTFNWVPSLLEQLDDYCSGRTSDPHLDLTRVPAALLSPEQKLAIVTDFFLGPPETMIKPHRRFWSLWLKKERAAGDRDRARDSFTEEDWRDLQVWSNLAWFDPLFRRGTPLTPLFEKGERFSEADKQVMLDYQFDILRQIVPTLKRLRAAGQIEVSFSPAYHPILPLLVDSRCAREALPDATLPDPPFRHPEDAREQIRSACVLYEELFGERLQGLWPPEGGVSADLVPLVTRQGIGWIATDQKIYERSVSAGGEPGLGLYQPYRVGTGDQSLAVFFRDHTLSDLIGFAYARWDAERAVNDLLERLHAIRAHLPEEALPRAAVSIILDGENAWEYYPEDGGRFLDLLYERLTGDPLLETITFGEYLRRHPDLPALSRLAAGSWIYGNFNVWIGQPEDNRAWEFLRAARALLQAKELAGAPAPQVEQARRTLSRAEGSDWFWWYGEDHRTEQKDIFDELFRAHLCEVYRALETSPPPDLLLPIGGEPARRSEPPSQVIHPTIDGQITHFYEWSGAGLYRVGAGSMRPAHAGVTRRIWYGLDETRLYLRCDFAKGVPVERLRTLRFRFDFQTQPPLAIELSGDRLTILPEQPPGTALISGKVETILELALPLELLSVGADRRVPVSFSVYAEKVLLETWPAHGALAIEIPPEVATAFWQA